MFPEHEGGIVVAGVVAQAGAPLERERDVLRVALSLLRDRLPSGWEMTESLEVPLGGRRADALLELVAPDGTGLTLVVECKRLLVPRDLPAVLAQLDNLRAAVDGPVGSMVVARYLPASVRARLDEAGVSYADATGNLRVVASRPAVFLRDRGADKDPWRGPGRPLGTLNGVPAGRVVRALADFAPPMSMRQLVDRSRASTGAAYRVVDFLTDQALITRDDEGRVTGVDWRAMLQRWSQDYAFGGTSTGAPAAGQGRFLYPRGLPALEAAIAAQAGPRYVVTGTMAASRWAAYAPPRLAMIYVDDPDRAMHAWGLRPVDAGANVLLAVPDSDDVYTRTVDRDGLTLAAPTQVAVDLITGPGRNPSEAEYLLDWMAAHESDWRQ
jgi:hypothetical protein